MKDFIILILFVVPLLIGLVSCDNQIDPISINEEVKSLPSSIGKSDESMWERHHNSKLKILAIGNSFTSNATHYMPELINNLNGNNICIATLIQGAYSLENHWNSYKNGTSDYILDYSYNGTWIRSNIKTINEALRLFDWDIIVIQQVSGKSGQYNTYQPYLDNLVSLFREINPGAVLVWHYTWAYTSGYTHEDFKNYNYDSEEMYNAIIEAGNQATLTFDWSIPSATLIKRMREEFPEVQNGFSNDGIHITDHFAQYSLSSLWYETLINPYFNTSCLDYPSFPNNVSISWQQKILNIIKELIGNEQNPDQPSSVGMITSD